MDKEVKPISEQTEKQMELGSPQHIGESILLELKIIMIKR